MSLPLLRVARRTLLLSLAGSALAGGSAAAQSFCASDGQPQPVALVERFIDADCDSCWVDPATQRPGAGELALDWVVPGARGEDAPLAAVAQRDALERLEILRRPRPRPQATVRSARKQGAGTLRVAHGLPLGGYIGTSIDFKPARPGAWTAWLALVETLPAGTEGSPVARNLVRNAHVLAWPPGAPRLSDRRPMTIPEGAQPERLRVVGWVEDARGVIRGISQSVCAPARRP